MTADNDWDDLMASLGLEPSAPRIPALALLAFPPVPCGTVTGYGRHYADGERPCRACQDAKNARQKALRDARRPPKPVSLTKRKPCRTGPTRMGPPPEAREHGTPRGARQHWSRNEAVCGPCRTAYNAWQMAHRASAKAA